MAWMVATQFLMYAIGWGLCSLLVREQRSSVAHWSLFKIGRASCRERV